MTTATLEKKIKITYDEIDEYWWDQHSSSPLPEWQQNSIEYWITEGKKLDEKYGKAPK